MYERHHSMVFKTSTWYAVLVAALLVSCSPANRLSRILVRHPDLAKNGRVDTFIADGIVQVDTFRITKTDTFSRNDTTFIRTSDTIRLNAKCRGIRETILIPCPKEKDHAKDSTKGRKRAVRKDNPIREPREGFFGRLERYAANGVLLMVFILGYVIGAAINRFLTKR